MLVRLVKASAPSPHSAPAASGPTDGRETLAYELWYKFQVTDNISVTPAFFWIENDGASDTYGGLVKTTFKF